MTWLMEILKIEVEGQILIKYCVVKHLIFLKLRNMMDININFLQCSMNILIKKILLVLVLKIRIFQTTELAEKLHKPIIKRFKKTIVHSAFIDNIWGANLANMQLLIL